MGLLERLRRHRDESGAEVGGFAVVRDRRFPQLEQLALRGALDEAVLTGIHRRPGSGSVDTILRLSWFRDEVRSAAVALEAAAPAAMRLGMTVAAHIDNGMARVNWGPMASGWELAAEPGQHPLATVPSEGMDDTAFDPRVLTRLVEWPAQRASVVSISRRSVFGVPSDTFDIVLRCEDGRARTDPNDVVPFYCAWYVEPGAQVPVVVDPKGGDRAQIHWPQLALERTVTAGHWRQPAPPQSVAAQLLRVRH